MKPEYRLAIPVVLGLLAAGVNFVILKRATATIEVLVAKEDMPAGVPITADKMTTLKIKADPKVYTNIFNKSQVEAIVGKTTRFPIKQGELLLRPNIDEDGAGNRSDLLQGKQQEWFFTVRTDNVSPDLYSGERVKVMVRSAETNESKTGAETLGPFQVLSVLKNQNTRDPSLRVTVAVTPEQEDRVKVLRALGVTGSAGDVVSVFRVAK